MKAAIGNSLLMGIIVTFVTIVLFILISSMVYTKAFRVKNRIVDVIENHGIYDTDTVEPKINELLWEVGYKVNNFSDNSRCMNYANFNGKTCDDMCTDSSDCCLENALSPYRYCVFRLKSGKNNGYYYKVVAFAYLDFPLISAIQVPVSGETKIFYPNV